MQTQMSGGPAMQSPTTGMSGMSGYSQMSPAAQGHQSGYMNQMSGQMSNAQQQMRLRQQQQQQMMAMQQPQQQQVRQGVFLFAFFAFLLFETNCGKA
jgi:hypothetical protein